MELVSFGQLYGKWLDRMAGLLAGESSGEQDPNVMQAMQMAQEAGLGSFNGDVFELNYSGLTRANEFKVEFTELGPVVVVPRGTFPELDHYEGGELLRYE